MTWGERLLVAFAFGCAASALGYSAARGVELALFPVESPAALLDATESPFAWRCWTALYLGGLGGLGGFALARREPAAAARWATRGAAIAAIGVVLQSALLP